MGENGKSGLKNDDLKVLPWLGKPLNISETSTGRPFFHWSSRRSCHRSLRPFPAQGISRQNPGRSKSCWRVCLFLVLINHQPSTINHQSSIIYHLSSIITIIIIIIIIPNVESVNALDYSGMEFWVQVPMGTPFRALLSNTHLVKHRDSLQFVLDK